METILFFCAHNDDQIIGAGGTIAKYAHEGKRVLVHIFSFGEGSHPHFRKSVIRKQRVKESMRSDKILGITQTSYWGIPEGKFAEALNTPRIMQKMESIMRKCRPSKVFTHSIDDPHPDHRAVYHSVAGIARKSCFKGEIYTFKIWNIVNFRRTNTPKLVVDISQTFKKKVRAFQSHRSQQLTMWTLMWNVYLQAILHGFNNGVRYAEVFSRDK